MKCIEYCLLQWEEMPHYRIWYDSNHTVIVEPEINLTDKGYLPLVAFGRNHLISSFGLCCTFIKLLDKYFESQ
jgi:hypothetical protein